MMTLPLREQDKRSEARSSREVQVPQLLYLRSLISNRLSLINLTPPPKEHLFHYSGNSDLTLSSYMARKWPNMAFNPPEPFIITLNVCSSQVIKSNQISRIHPALQTMVKKRYGDTSDMYRNSRVHWFINRNISRLMRLWHLSPSVNPIFKHACAAIQCGYMSDFWSDPSSTSIRYVREQRRMRSLAWVFAVRLCDKYHNLMSWLILLKRIIIYDIY